MVSNIPASKLAPFPNDQGDRGDFACQSETSHRWSPAFGEQSLVKIVKGSGGDAGPRGRTLEDIFQIVVMVGIQSAKLLWFLGTLQLSFDTAVLRAVVCLQTQPAVSPQLPLGAKPVGRLHQRDQLRRPNRTDTRNLA